MRWVLCALLATLPAACSPDRQFLAVPGAVLVPGSPNYTYPAAYTGATPPSFTFTRNDGVLTPDDSVVLRVDITAVTEIEVTELVLLTLDGSTVFPEHWRIDLTEEELAEGIAELEIHALADKPEKEWCARDYRGVGTCYQKANEGVTGIGLAGAGGDATTAPVVVPIQLDSLSSSEPDICSTYTAADCCTASGGVTVLQCAWDPACPCPGGTSEAGFDGMGYRLCDCPG